MTEGRVLVDITMSLDGFITGPNDSVELPLGEGGERLHQWVYDLATWLRRHGLAGGRTSASASDPRARVTTSPTIPQPDVENDAAAPTQS